MLLIALFKIMENPDGTHTQTKIFENTNWPIRMHRLSYNKKISCSANISIMTLCYACLLCETDNKFDSCNCKREKVTNYVPKSEMKFLQEKK